MNLPPKRDPHAIKGMGLVKKFFLSLTVLLLLALSVILLWVSNNYVVPVLMYHEVGNPQKTGSNIVSAEVFERHLQFMTDHHYNVISMDEYITAQIQGRKLPRNTLVITFDDGYENNYTYGFTSLSKHEFPATIFLVSNYINNEQFLTIDQIREMKKSGLITFGSHTLNHLYLPDQDLATQKKEIMESKKILEGLLGEEVKYFAYPVGGYNEQIKKIVQEAGYEAALATNRGYDRSNKDLFTINRIRLSDKDQEWWDLWMKFSGYYNLLRKQKSPY